MMLLEGSANEALVATSGIATLLGAPIAEIEALAPGDIALVGLFMDHGDSRGFGARFAARQIRYASRRAYCMGPAMSTSIASSTRVFDLGDLNVFPLEPARQREALERQFRLLLGTGARLVVVGGAMQLDEIMIRAASQCADLAELRPVTIAGTDRPEMISQDLQLFASVDLTHFLGPSCGTRPKAQLLASIRALPASRVRVAHVLGLAPELDLTARNETAVAVLALDSLVRHLQTGATACH